MPLSTCRLLACALAFAATQAHAAALADPSAPAPVVVRIGLSAPLSGLMAEAGRTVREAAQLAIDDLQASRPTLDGVPLRLELVAVDDGADPSRADAAVAALVQAGVAGVVGPLNSGVALRAAPLFAQAGLPMISPSATHPGLTRQGLPTTFRVVADDAALARRLLAYVATQRHVRRAVLVSEPSPYGKVMAALFAEAAPAAGIEIVDQQSLLAGPAAAPGRLAAQPPDAVIVAGGDTAGAALAQALHERGLQVLVVGGDGMCSPRFARLAGPLAADSVLCAREGVRSPLPSAAVAAVDRRLAQRLGAPVDSEENYAPQAYDAVLALVAAMTLAGSGDPAVYAPRLRSVRLPDAVAGPLRFDDRGDVPDGAIALFTYDGRERVYKSPLP